MNNGWTQQTYTYFRAALGVYLLVHFGQLLPYGGELFSNQGVLPDGAASPILFLFPNILAAVDQTWMVTTLLSAAMGLSFCLILGKGDRLAAFGLYYVWACLLGRNPLILNPSLPYVGWLLLAHGLMPQQKDKEDTNFIPPMLFGAAWTLMALGYSYSGYYKLLSPSWLDGTAIAAVLDNPLARPGLARDLLLTMPWLLKGITWITLAAELCFAPLALFKRARPWIWSLLLCMHFNIIFLVDFADLTMGMVLLHMYTFDPDWIKGKFQLKGAKSNITPNSNSMPQPIG